MFVDFMMCFKYSRGSLARKDKLSMSINGEQNSTHDIVVDTLTRFSHSNSVHMLRNYRGVTCAERQRRTVMKTPGRTCASVQKAGLM